MTLFDERGDHRTRAFSESILTDTLVNIDSENAAERPPSLGFQPDARPTA